MKKMRKTFAILFGIAVLFANVKAGDSQETRTKQDDHAMVKKSSLSKYLPFVAAGAVVLIVGGVAGRYFFSSNPNGSNPNNQHPITDQEAQSFVKEAGQVDPGTGDVEKWNLLYKNIDATKFDAALKAWESSNVIDPCLQPFIKEYFSNPRFQHLVTKHPTVFAELQQGNFPSILTKADNFSLKQKLIEYFKMIVMVKSQLSIEQLLEMLKQTELVVEEASSKAQQQSDKEVLQRSKEQLAALSKQGDEVREQIRQQEELQKKSATQQKIIPQDGQKSTNARLLQETQALLETLKNQPSFKEGIRPRDSQLNEETQIFLKQLTDKAETLKKELEENNKAETLEKELEENAQ